MSNKPEGTQLSLHVFVLDGFLGLQASYDFINEASADREFAAVAPELRLDPSLPIPLICKYYF